MIEPRETTPEEDKAIRSLQRLAKRWPESLMLLSWSGSLCVVALDENSEPPDERDGQRCPSTPCVPHWPAGRAQRPTQLTLRERDLTIASDYGRLTAEVIAAVTWAVANLHLDVLARRGAELDAVIARDKAAAS